MCAVLIERPTISVRTTYINNDGVVRPYEYEGDVKEEAGSFGININSNL